MTRSRTTILLAEDDENDAFLFRRALGKAGLSHELVRVCNGEECIGYLRGISRFEDRDQYPLPNLLVLDLKMPGVSGLDVLDWLQTQPALKQIPAVMLSGSGLAPDRQAALAKGAKEYHAKPVGFAALVEILKGLSARWLTPDASPGAGK